MNPLRPAPAPSELALESSVHELEERARRNSERVRAQETTLSEISETVKFQAQVLMELATARADLAHVRLELNQAQRQRSWNTKTLVAILALVLPFMENLMKPLIALWLKGAP
jgi:hypothetical protein